MKKIIKIFIFLFLIMISYNVYALDELKTCLYEIKDTEYGKIIIGAEENTKVYNFINKLNVSPDYLEVYEVNGDRLNYTYDDIVKTGMKIKYVKDNNTLDEVTIVIRGDVNSDGAINVLDKVILQDHILLLNELNDYRLYSLDLDNQNGIENINISDNVILGDYILKKNNINLNTNTNYCKPPIDERASIVSINSTNYFKAEPYKSKIKTATFVNYIDTSKADMTWDLSTAKNGDVMAWVTPNGDYYDLYIGSNKIIAPRGTNAANLFHSLSALETIRFNGLLDLSEATSISSMFFKCESLTSVDFETLDTSNIDIMTSLFSGDKALEYIDLSNIDTTKVTKLNSVFSDCIKIKELDLSNFNTDNVTDMSYLFNGMTSLKSLDISSFNTSKVTNMSHMFRGDASLESLDVSNFDTSKVTNMYMMFYSVRSLKELDVSNFNTENVTNMGSMFYNLKSLTTLDLSNFNTEKVTSMNAMFNGCDNITNINVNSFNTEKVTDMASMFANCLALETLDLSSFDTRSVTTTKSMFYLSRKIKTVYVSDKWDTSNVTEGITMFANASSIVGGNGTIYNKDHTTAEYARIDGLNGLPGYFTLKQ